MTGTQELEPLDLALAGFKVLRREMDSARSAEGRWALWARFQQTSGGLNRRDSEAAPWDLVDRYERRSGDAMVRAEAAAGLKSFDRSRLHLHLVADGPKGEQLASELREATACRLLAELSLVSRYPQLVGEVITDDIDALTELATTGSGSLPPEERLAVRRLVQEVTRLFEAESAIAPDRGGSRHGVGATVVVGASIGSL